MDPLIRVIILASLWLVYCVALILLFSAVIWVARTVRRRLNTTQLLGPKRYRDGLDIAGCAAMYGPVFSIPRRAFDRTVVLCDGAAIEHFYAQTPDVYRQTPANRRWTENMVGPGLAWVDGEQHEAYRQVLSPLFSNTVEGYAPIFFSVANKAHHVWENALASRPHGMVVEISHWMNSVVLDSLGLAGFGHDFDSLAGEYCSVTAGFYALRAPVVTSADSIFKTAPNSWMWPLLRNWPGPRSRIVRDFHARVRRIGRQVLARHKPVKMLDVGEGQADWSFIGLLIKALAEDPAGERRLSHKEVMTQINTWLFSGFETTAASLTWLLIELAKHPEMQDRLRIELRQLPDDAEYSEIARLPYLHSVVYETLRLHPPIGTTTRVASQDDIIPLSAPISTKSGDLVNSLKIAKGTHVRVPIRPVNTAKEFWGPGAGSFDPERWWNISAEEYGEAVVVGGGGSHSGSSGRIMHLAFGDGSRACIGAGVALALMKVVVFVLVRRYAFALPHGAQAQIQAVGEPVARPQVKTRMDSDPAGTAVMMGVRKLTG